MGDPARGSRQTANNPPIIASEAAAIHHHRRARRLRCELGTRFNTRLH
jgi:hypothetical protein